MNLAVAMHQLHGLRGAGYRLELRVRGERRIELRAPTAIEVDGVDQEHHEIGVDRIEDRWNLAIGLGVDPPVDGSERPWDVGEVQTADFGVEGRFGNIEETLI